MWGILGEVSPEDCRSCAASASNVSNDSEAELFFLTPSNRTDFFLSPLGLETRMVTLGLDFRLDARSLFSDLRRSDLEEERSRDRSAEERSLGEAEDVTETSPDRSSNDDLRFDRFTLTSTGSI